jgi:Response regulator containing a CheY-like receiver domain and an HTH DNA-binding domain
VTAGVARGLKNNAIATLLGLSVETVKSHVGNAMDKLGARDRTQMAVTALLYGLIDPLQ